MRPGDVVGFLHLGQGAERLGEGRLVRAGIKVHESEGEQAETGPAWIHDGAVGGDDTRRVQAPDTVAGG